MDTLWVWVALFALGILGILIRFFSAKQAKIEKMYEKMLQKQQEIERSQSLFLANISENIHEIIEKSYKETTTCKEEQPAIREMVKGKKLLDVTHDLIEFLRLKSKKVQVSHEKFNLNNVLNEVSGTVCTRFKGSPVELIFDIDNNIPRYLIGDLLNLEKVLRHLLEYFLQENSQGEIKLEIAMFGNYEEKIQLQFKLSDMGEGLDAKAMESLFIPVYNEENKEYSGLGLFVAKELITMMQGELAVHSVVGKGTSFTISLPFEMLDPKNRRNYRLPDKVLTAKKVFIADRNYNSALALKKMFAYFRHDVKVVNKEEFLAHKPDLKAYDIVILDLSLFQAKTVAYLEKIKKEKDLKVVALDSLLEREESRNTDAVIDRVLIKPANQERIFELIVNLYTLKQIRKTPVEEIPQEHELTHRTDIIETTNVSQQSFRDFSGMQLLIVEDDEINQKVLLNILKISGIEVSVANNGREAVEIIKEKDGSFDLVLMDINMPVMDGYTATQMIRLESEFNELPIVAFTALALESEKEKIFNSGMNAYLTKPINIGKLYTVFKMYHRLSSKQKVTATPQRRTFSKDILDVEKGIVYANRNEGFYMEILQEFLDAYGQSTEVFAKLIREHRYEQIKMLCIDMKGLSGTIGAKEMFGLIIEIHQKVLYHQEDMLVNYVDAYGKALRKLTDEIHRYLNMPST
ncbi:multi-sensor hybrid histidine kinase [hydrothermal vent metagenome]|uniref:Multi-sensor hybrid histidine kinase n=1 Tax=hydrothermal vent metagenome TaxID=652676 RepID=A0A1W1E867_9ZZZZ